MIKANSAKHQSAPLRPQGQMVLQRKLSIGASNDPMELEADRVADQVLAYQPAHSFSNIAVPKIQRRTEDSTGQVEKAPASVERVLTTSGNPLPIIVRKDMEQRFAQDFSQVRIHTGSEAEQSAREVNANAYTLGNTIVFGAGQYNPESQTGKHLLAHELTHVIQSTKGSQLRRDTIHRQPTAVAANERKLLGLPKGGIYLKTTPENKKDNNFSGALVENGDTVLIKNEKAQQFRSVKSGAWAWVEVPGKTSPQKDYPVMHGFIETKYFNAVPKAEASSNPSQTNPSQATKEPKKNIGPALLNDTELETEINLMRDWLREHSDANVAKNLALLEAEAMDRVDKEKKAAEAAKPQTAAAPEADIGDLESALRTLKSGIYVSPLDQGASGASAVGPSDAAQSALDSVDEKFLIPMTDEMALNPVLRLEGSIKQLEIRIAKQKQSIAGWSTEAKLKKSVESAIGQIGGEVGERLKELLTPESLAIMAAFVIAYVVSQTTPIGWLADILVAGMIAATILMVGREAIEIVKLLIEFVDKAKSAKSQADIDAAGKALATAITKAGVDVILAILLHKAGKAANLKPPGPRSPGLVEVLKTGGEKVMTTITEPAASGWRVAPEGISPWEMNMSMMEASPKTSSAPKSSSGSGKGSGTPKATGEPAKPTPGQKLSASGALPKKPIAEAIRGKNSPAETAPNKPPAVEEPVAEKPAADKPKSETPAKNTAPAEGVSAKVDPQQGVKTALERVDKKIANAKAEMAEKGKEITQLAKEVETLRDTLKNTPKSEAGRAPMLEEFQAKQKQLTELREQQAHRKSLNDLDLDTRTRLKNALDAKTYARPGFTEAQRAAIWEQAKKDGGGKVTSPSGVEIKPGDPWEVGHKPKYEFWKHVRSAAERGISREQFLRECKDLKKYRPETPKDNSSHAFEDATDAYLGE